MLGPHLRGVTQLGYHHRNLCCASVPLLIETAYIGILIISSIVSGLEASISNVCDSMCEA